MKLFHRKREALSLDGRLSHIAFIMDGNGRWAKRRGLPRKAGHAAGAEACRRVFRRCHELGITTVTVYAFSTENWKRPKEEVEALMALFDRYLDEVMADLSSYNARFVFLGERDPLPAALRDKMTELERRSAESGSAYTLNFAINYGGRDEILHAANAAIAEGKTHLSAADIEAHLYTESDPDLIVRTAGEKRLSNFLLWQASYSEFYFTDRLWPDMSANDVDKAVRAFLDRTRRYGGLK